MAAEEPARRSSRVRKAAAKTPLDTAAIQDTAPHPATAPKTEKHGPTKKRQAPLNEPEEATTEPELASSAKNHPPQYLCPIPGCTFNLSIARGIKQHYVGDHADVTDKEEWKTELAVVIPYDDWLVKKKKPSLIEADRKRREERSRKLKEERELDAMVRRTAGTKEKEKGRGKGTKVKHTQKNETSLRASGIHQKSSEEQPPRSASAPSLTDPASAFAGEGEVPPKSQAPATLVITEEGSSPPAAKRRRLDDLLTAHKNQLQTFIQQELQKAQDKADNAEVLLQRLKMRREAVVSDTTQEEAERLKMELERNKEQMKRGSEHWRARSKTRKISAARQH